jgi:hypothetical protein
MTRFWDKDGTELELNEWAHKYEDRDYRRIDETDVLTLDGRLLWVSTVWIGFCQKLWLCLPDDVPFLTFETQVFENGFVTSYQHHHSTLAEAEAGHARLVARLHEVGATALDEHEAWHP